MSLAPKNKTEAAWQPSASIALLKKRARIIQLIRQFFDARDVMEVETPLLCHTSVTDPFIQSIPAFFQKQGQTISQQYYLQTSPEYAMKRLLAAGCGSIYQITKAFRQGEVGQFHNPEFTMMEWYRIGFDHHDLMNEMDELLQLVLQTPPAERATYAALFEKYLALNPHTATLDKLAACAKRCNIQFEGDITDKDTWLQLLMSEYIEPRVGLTRPIFIYDFPAQQAALARIQAGAIPVASRFEVYFQGIELANGFHELKNAAEQRKRFEHNLHERKNHGLAELPIDEYFLAALDHGLPDCAGVALGIDRLVMLATKASRISEVISLDFSRV